MTALVEEIPATPWTPPHGAFPPPPERDTERVGAARHEAAARELEGASAEEILRWAASEFGPGLVVTASMADGVLAHVAGRAVPGTRVLFLDTGYHFAETLGTRDAVAATTPVDVRTVAPPLTKAQHEAEFGKLYETNPDLCCQIRKVWPLDQALRPYTAWASGIRRSESATRAKTPVVGLGRAAAPGQGEPARAVDGRAGRRVRDRARHPRQPAPRDRVCLHRLRALHPPRRAGRGPARRPLGGPGQDGVRDPHVTAPAYPLLLDVAGRRCVVVGGGPVAARRARGLASAGAEVVLVAPGVCEDAFDLVVAGGARWLQRSYEPGDLDGAWVVHTATGDREVDAQVTADAENARVWCVRAGDAEQSTAWTPAVARVGDVTVAVNAGADPRRSSVLRAAVQTALDTGTLPVRRHRPGRGHVALVGGGPGLASLITARGRQLLAEADVVITDRLGPRALLDHLDPDVEVIDVGKAPGHHPVPQDEINELLVEHASAGRRVVRLKGGDPYVLGRGGEEALACREAGVDVEVVPGVTSAVSVPAAVGIPVTHRGLSKQFTVVSGHEGLDWPSLASVEGTLIFLMGVTLLAETAAQLIAHGKDPSTPAAVVEDGYGPRQRLVSGRLETIADDAERAGVRPPAVVVVGDVVALAAQLG